MSYFLQKTTEISSKMSYFLQKTSEIFWKRLELFWITRELHQNIGLVQLLFDVPLTTAPCEKKHLMTQGEKGDKSFLRARTRTHIQRVLCFLLSLLSHISLNPWKATSYKSSEGHFCPNCCHTAVTDSPKPLQNNKLQTFWRAFLPKLLSHCCHNPLGSKENEGLVR